MAQRLLSFDKLPFVFPAEQSIQAIGNEMDFLLERVKDTRLKGKTGRIIAECLEHCGLSSASFFFPLAAEIAGLIDRDAEYAKGLTYAGGANSYHNVTHMQEVIINAALLLSACDAHKADFGFAFNAEEKALLYFAALIHDLGHTGFPNGGRNFAREEESFLLAEPFIAKYAGKNASPLKDKLKAMLFATDIGYDTQVLALILAFHRKQRTGAAEGSRVLSPLPKPSLPDDAESFALLLDDANLAELTAILCDADIASSTFYNFSRSWEESLLLAGELAGTGKNLYKSAHTQALKNFNFFTENVVSIKSKAGELFMPNFKRIKEASQTLLASGSK